MASPLLDLTNSEGFRKKLLTRNLTPYAKAPNRPTQPIDTEYVQSNSSVQDSPDKLIDEPSFANKLYPLNQYGNEGGYEQVPDPGALLNTKSNEGEYGYQDANIVGQSLPESQKWKPLNVFSNGNEVALDGAEFFSSLNRPVSTNTQNNQPYPTTFVSSTYTPVSILLSPDPSGSNGLLSQDSFIARLGAQTLRKEFNERIASQIRQDTLGRANILNVSSGTDIVNILTGVVPIIEPVYTITVTANPILAATNFALRLGGSILPVSPIPGSYFDPNTTLGQPTTIQQLSNAFRQSGVGKFFNRLMGGGETGSQIMFNNMGAGQRSRLFKNIDFNRYKPNFPRNFFQRVGGTLLGTVSDNSNFYVGSITSNPSQVFSPVGDVPVNQFGVEQQSPVYGPSELAQLYEGPSQSIRLGANGPTYSNGGGIEGGFTWVSPKYRGNAGKKVGIGGEVTEQDEDFRPSSYVNTESVNNDFRDGSILDKTQRIIDSQPQGGKRLQHVGNAIDQVSKVFNDGYKELTKGSRVYRYVGAIGQEVGTEYCRVFAKDLPYLQYNDLQKTDGITTEGRRFAYSVLDKTYNLNIVPNKQEGGQDSTNIVGTINNAVAKKYMFSLENLAWRTSSTPGFSTSDLPVCERGPNGGRVMWFPPYGLTFSENVSSNWNQSDFLGRPEPIYTYKNTSRTGSLQWKIVVDHPSVLNVIVNKVLGNETNKTRVDSILESFFAGCRKYDIYELAKKYVTVNPNDLFELQQAISSKEMTREQIVYTRGTIETGAFSPNGETQPLAQEGGGGNTNLNFDKYLQLGFYFGNDYPKPKTSINYTTEYARYSGEVKTEYSTKDNAQETKTFFDTAVTPNYEAMNEFAMDLGKQLETNEGTVTVYVSASCSAPQTVSYNDALSIRRIESTVRFFEENNATKTFIAQKRLMVKTDPGTPQERAGALGERAVSNPRKSNLTKGPYIDSLEANGATFDCSDSNPSADGGDTPVGAKEVFTVGAMACRRSFISKIVPNLKAPQTGPNGQGTPGGQTNPTTSSGTIPILIGNVVTQTVPEPIIEPRWEPRDNITKKVVRALLSECDYFETIKAETPMVYDNLKDKLKFFQPSFHSMTPEGLNSRLTFLQQCMRPGDTIPTVKQSTPGGKQELQYDNATNTSFGAPPVLVLRVGDFYNTKIIPTSLAINYEGLDINPEGIGVQPMIANVTLSFNFVGGSGLKESVDKLQNALTFNYYANTEIYDDRADATDIESSKILDQIFLAGQVPPPIPGVNSAAPNNGQDNNNTIGTIVSSLIDVSGITTGVISYSEFMGKVVSDTQTYFTNVVNKTKETVNQYNNAVRQQWMLERNYTQGNFNVDDDPVVLFGKPNNVEKRFDEIFVQLDEDIKDDTEGFIKFISEPSKNLSPKLIRALKENYRNFVSKKRSSFQNGISTITQSLVNEEQTYLQTLGRLNTILFDPTESNTGTDGLQAKNGPVRIYVTSGTTDVHPTSTSAVTDTYLELVQDTTKIQQDIAAFNVIIQDRKKFVYPATSTTYEGILVFETANGKSNVVTVEKVFLPFSTNPLFGDNVENYPFRRVYMIISDDVIDEKKYETFKQELIGNVLGNQALLGDGSVDIERIFDTYWIATARPIFLEENNITKSFIENLEKNDLKDYLIYTPFDSTKQRNLTFTTENSADSGQKTSQENMIKGLANTTNQNTNVLTWNDTNGNATGAYISKAKLN
jgi:hypothetical protein